DPFQQGGGIARRAHLIAEPRERLRQHQADRGVVVGDQDLLVGRIHPGMSSSAAMGSNTRNTVRPGSDSKSSSPPCAATSLATSARPSPAPFGLVVTKGWNRCSRRWPGTPGPLSTMRTSSG